MKINPHYVALTCIVTIIGVTALTYFLISSNQPFSQWRTFSGICLNSTLKNKNLCASCLNKKELKSLQHKGIHVQSNQIFHIITFKQRSYMHCEEMLQLIDNRQMEFKDVFAFQNIESIQQILKIDNASIHLQNQTSFQMGRQVHELTIYQLISEDHMHNVRVGTPSARFHELVLTFMEVISIVGAIFCLAIEVIKFTLHIELQASNFMIFMQNTLIFFFVSGVTYADVNSKLFDFIIGLFLVVVLNKTINKVTIIVGITFGLVLVTSDVVILFLEVCSTLTIFIFYKEEKSFNQPKLYLSFLFSFVFLINQFVLRIPLREKSDNFSIILQYSIIVILPLFLEIIDIAYHLKNQNNGIKVSDEQISQLKEEEFQHSQK